MARPSRIGLFTPEALDAGAEMPPPVVLGRYAVYAPIASGGMGTVHLGRIVGGGGFTRVVAIKRMHGHLIADDECVAAFLDEARLAARIRHPNVVSTLDVVEEEGVVLLVLDYVAGTSLSQLCRTLNGRGVLMPPAVASSVVVGMLHGLHAAHEACDESGAPLGIVHRDVSPQNVLIDTDGTARLVDFGIAKASRRAQSTTQSGFVKGKFSYLAPEQRQGHGADRRADIYAAGVVLWETLTGRSLIDTQHGSESSVEGTSPLVVGVPAPSSFEPRLSSRVDEVVLKALCVDPAERYATARDFALALEEAITPAAPWLVAEWFGGVMQATLAEQARRVAAIERTPLAGSEPRMSVRSRGAASREPAREADREPATRAEPRRSTGAFALARDASEITWLPPRRPIARILAGALFVATMAVGLVAAARSSDVLAMANAGGPSAPTAAARTVARAAHPLAVTSRTPRHKLGARPRNHGANVPHVAVATPVLELDALATPVLPDPGVQTPTDVPADPTSASPAPAPGVAPSLAEDATPDAL